MIIILRSVSCMGKSHLASFYPKEAVVSSDEIRSEVFGTFNIHPSQSYLIWEEVYRRIELRIKQRMVCIVDATNLTLKTINKYKKIASKYDCPVKVVSITPDVDLVRSRMEDRMLGISKGAKVPGADLDRQIEKYHQEVDKIKRVFEYDFFEGNFQDCRFFIDEVIHDRNTHVVYGDVYVLGDVHGCLAELKQALSMIPSNALIYSTGDMIDRGEDSMGCLLALTNDPRFGGFSMGNHEFSFLREILEGANCRSTPRKRTHEEFKSLTSSEQELVINFLKTGKSYIILENPDLRERVLLSHAGIGNFDSINMSVMQSSSDNVNPVSVDTDIDGISFQIHGHMHWQFVKDEIDGNVINIDSGVCYGKHLTAFNVFDPHNSIYVKKESGVYEES